MGKERQVKKQATKIRWPILVGIAVLILRLRFADNALKTLYPFALLFTPFREATLRAWEKVVPIDRSVYYPPRPIPEIHASDYSYDAMSLATDNFRRPAVIRGLFNSSRAVQNWEDREYLATAFESIYIPVVRDGSLGTLQDDREIELFSTSFQRIFDSEYSKEYLFFPAKSRFTFKGVGAEEAQRLEERGNQIVKSDLDLNLIRPGLGDSGDSQFVTAQFVIGKAPHDPKILPTGSDFHCAGANNWFIQVVGRKRWEFIMPEYSAYAWPLKGGLLNFWTGNKHMDEMSRHVPTEFVDLEPGDVLLNPPWQWHKITNYGGLSIGVPIREKNPFNTLVNNPYFAIITACNVILSKLGFSNGTGGLPPPSMATEHDN